MIDFTNNSPFIDNSRPWFSTYERYHIKPYIDMPEEHISLIDLFEQQLHQFKQRDAYVCFGEYLSYQQLDEASLKIATYLQQIGLNKGDKVAIMLPNILQYPVIALGILRAGMTIVNVNPFYASRELAYQLDDAQVKVLFIFENFAKTYEAVVNDDILQVVICRLGDMLNRFKGILVNFTTPHHKYKLVKPTYFLDIIKNTYSNNYQRPSVQLTDVALLQYTGGTTGIAKGAMLTHGNIIANILQIDTLITSAFDDDSYKADRVLTALPLYHVFAFTLCCMYSLYRGYAGLLIADPNNINNMIDEIKKYPVNFFIGVNNLFNSLIHHPEFRLLDFSQVKASIGGGMSILPTVAKEWHHITGMPIIEGYGLSETSPVVTFNPMTIARFTNKIGIPAPSTDVKILDEHDNEVAIGERGEIAVKGLQVMKGYQNQPEETALAFTADGYFRTGDIGIIDERGFIKIVDRKKDMILVSGFNVYPNEIEEIMNEHPDVVESGVIGIPHEIRGEEPKIFIVRKSHKITEQELLDFARQRLTDYKRPTMIEFVPSLPKSPVGKILRKELRKMAGLA